jgi:hypothetical protein
LDASVRLPAEQLPLTAVEFKGTWDASTNTPALADGVGNLGDMYRVSVPGVQAGVDFAVGDVILYDGSNWRRMGGGYGVFEKVSNKGVNNGYASLDAAGKLPSSQLSLSALEYKGVWDAATNTPPLAAGVGTPGDMWRVNVSGTQFGVKFTAGDFALFNGTEWENATSGTAGVSSVAGLTGDVAAAPLKTALAVDEVDNTRDIDKNVFSASRLTTARTLNGVSFDGTADITVPVDPATDALYEKVAKKGVADGYASLGADGKVPAAQLPPAGVSADAGNTSVLGTDNLVFTPSVLDANGQLPESALPDGVELVAQKGVPDGYAPLGADNLIPAVHLPPSADTMAELTDVTPVGLAVGTAADEAAARDAIDAETTLSKGQPDGYAPLTGGLVPTQHLPSYVDDVVEAANLAAFPATGEAGKIYVALDSGMTYRWSGSTYIAISDKVTSTGITDSTVVGRKVITAVDEQAGRTAIGAERRRTVNVRDFGAKGDFNTTTQTGTDDSAAFAAAIAAASAGGANAGMTVVVPPGNYRLTSTFLVSQLGIIVEGDYATALYIDHTAGPGVHITKGYTSLRRIRVIASAARKAAAFDNENIGVLVETEDTPNNYCSKTEISDVESSDHPSHGFVFVGYAVHSLYQRVSSFRNKGHGIVIDGGELTGRVNTTEPGISTLQHGWSMLNGGHGLLLGNPNSKATPFRMRVDNFECTDNSKDAAVRFTPDEAWVFGENCEIHQSAFGPLTTDMTRYGVRVAGRGWNIQNLRMVGLGRSITLSGDTINNTAPYANKVEHIRVFGSVQPVGVVIESGVYASLVHLPYAVNMTIPVQEAAPSVPVKDGGNAISTFPLQATPAVLAATQNDYDWGLGKRTVRLSGAAGGSTITGFAHPSSGRQFRLINVSANPITIPNYSSLSGFYNRVTTHTGADLVLKSNESVLVEYDASQSRWRTLDMVPSGFAALGHTHVAADVVGALSWTTTVPGTPAAAGTRGQFTSDGQFLYVCVTSGAAGAAVWKRLAFEIWV